MKLNDLLTEAPLASYGKNYAGPRLGPNNIGFPNGDTVKQLKTALTKHQLYIPGQPPNPAQKAWIGDNTGEWTQALSDAIIQWKRSINAQDKSAKLDAQTPELSPRDIDYLIHSKLYSDGTQAGFLLKTDSGKRQSTTKTAPWQGSTVDVGTVINTPKESIKTVRDFLAAITFSGWSVILEELLAKKNYLSKSRGAEMQRMLKNIYVKQNATPVIWLQSWEDNVLREDGENLKATLENGNEIPFHPMREPSFDTNWGSMELGSQRLYEYFQSLGNGLLRKYQAQLKAAQEKDKEVKDQEDENPTFTQQQKITVWARDMNTALVYAWYDFRGIDEKSVSYLMNQLQNAKDWDVVSQKYQDMFNEDLSQQLADSLSDEDYNSFVFRKLSMIKKINHNPLFASIIFGNTEDSIDVELNNDRYTIMKAKQNGKIVVKKGKKEIKNAILIEEILKAAISQTGGVVPNFNIELTDESKEEAANLVIISIQQIAPYLVPYYTVQPPFDQSITPGRGPQRLKGIQEESAKLLLNGVKNEGVLSWIAQQITNDAEELIQSKELHWDKRWKESDGGAKLAELGGILDVQDATDSERDLVDRLHREETREDAVNELLNTNAPEEMYERIYRLFKQKYGGKTFDSRVFAGNTNEVRDFIMTGTGITDPGFLRVAETIGIAKAAPYTLAQLFEDSMKGNWWELFGGTNEELADKLTDVIIDREDYILVNEYYKGAPVNAGNDLIEDLRKEQWFGLFNDTYYNKLAQALGLPTITELAEANLDQELLNILADTATEPTEKNLKRVKDVLAKENNEYFSTILNNGETSNIINSKGVTAFYKMLDDIRQVRIYSEEEQEIFFDIIDSVDRELLRLAKINPNNRVNRARYENWKEWYNSARESWFD